ncbi:THAP domain [Popillia japonica]|uniref:THAP domain n=1 Tax=Popillia japonica TaxID=7064 RepID=A0AAW1JFR6_POPJA
MVFYCAICRTNSTHKRFCLPNPKRMDLEETFNDWLQVIGNPSYLNKPKDYLYKNVRVCALHFKQDDFCMELNKGILKYGVIPSVNLKEPLTLFEVDKQYVTEYDDIQMPGPSSAAQPPNIDIVQQSSILQKCIASTKSMKRKATTWTKRNTMKKLQRMSKEAATFIQCQMTESGKRKKGRRFTTSEKIFSLSLYKQGPKAYRYCRNIFALPSPATLSKLLQQLPLKIGNYCNYTYYIFRFT